ncbi:30S ribosomal protein S20 [Venenivibrio stagnispumantis]|uniref:Small ribosomal subunit protein bS20 n=1 Tax=Venenivibrio stagnispumantis TaxID=407998 RepID=A0AA45WKV8_9AQUI|nr:30S ribosomal protein S20 [Venenivibrio stagnispumantis]MCW4573102.1 30S ribosomal protein S20 [Venenivibrio stagnispumantis]SMP09092.1 small subunit ribosomal protein S20 [Venenivibrio stagnispumantis]
MAKATLSPEKQKHKRKVKKNVRQAEKRRLQNRYHISRMKTAFKKFNEVLKKEGAEAAAKLLPLCQKLAMKAAAKGAIHKNEASRRISRAALKLKKALQNQQAA